MYFTLYLDAVQFSFTGWVGGWKIGEICYTQLKTETEVEVEVGVELGKKSKEKQTQFLTKDAHKL